MLLLLLACSTPPKDTAGTGETGETGESADTASPDLWTASVACGDLRFVLGDGASGAGMALDVPDGLYDALVAGEPFTGTWNAGDGGYGVLVDRVVADGEMCSSIEEWVNTSDAEPWWSVASGTVAYTLTPDHAWGTDQNPEWAWDGTPLGALELTGDGLGFTPRGTATGDRELPGFTTTVTYARYDLPA